MKKRFKTVSKRLTVLSVFLSLVFCSPFFGPCANATDHSESETFTAALIKDKDDHGVFIDGRRYRVNESTVILDILGKEIPICDLPVPCKASVIYKIVKGLEPVALRIEVKRLLENTTDKE